MTSLLDFHALAAARGEGLHPELRRLFERAAVSSTSDLAVRHDGFLQSGPNPASETAPGHVNVSRFPQAQMGETDVPRRSPERPARPGVAAGK